MVERPLSGKMTRTRRAVLGAIGAAAVGGLAGCLGSEDWSGDVDGLAFGVDEVLVYQSPGCSCCGEYADYLAERTDATVREETVDDLDAVKRDLGVSGDVESCHTVDAGRYVIEGHVPAEAIAELLDREPEIAGIGLPGMPAGSPGMGGSIDDPLEVLAIGESGETEPFVEV